MDHISSLSRAASIASPIPLPRSRAVFSRRPQSIPSIAPFTRSLTAYPRLSQWKFLINSSAPATAALIAFAMVLPILVNSPGVSRKPLRNVAMLLAILWRADLILPHGILSRASLSLSPTIRPTSVKSALAHAFFIMSARFPRSLSIGTSSNPPPVSAAPPPPPLLVSFFFRISTSSNPASDFSAAFAALASFPSPFAAEFAAAAVDACTLEAFMNVLFPVRAAINIPTLLTASESALMRVVSGGSAT